MSLGVRSVIFDIIGRDNASKAFLSASRAADAAATRLDRSVGRMYASGVKMQAVGQKMSKVITLPVAAATAFAIHEAAKYDKALNTIQVATDKTDKQMRQASAGIKKNAVATGTSLDGMTDAFYVAAKGGYTVAKSLDIARIAAQGAKAENADLGVVTNALTSVLASYGHAIKSPVAAMNMIIRGAGLAKTTIQDFSASLSNVVPVASSLHISFADVAAAIATMTQHGETAQHATENLRNLITNLAGTNNVASQTMQQLGINTVDLRKNLGSQGLVKTLQTVIAAAQKATGKDGLIHVSNLKAAALATHSLSAMLGTMTGKLKTQSEALLKGKIGITDYRKFARSLGGQLGPMGVQFLTLYQNTKGFSNLLKTGNGSVMTFATALKNMLGGMTGMNVSLQLSGESAKRFSDDAKSVGDAAKHAGNNVIGWDKTQALFTTRLDKTKAALQVLAVNIGNALLPYVQKLVGWLQSAVTWLGNLSSTKKKILLWTVGILAVLGPVLAIFGRLIKLFATFARIAIGGSRFIAGMRGMQRSMEVMGTSAYKAGSRVTSAMRTSASEAELNAAAMQRSAGRVAVAEATQTRAVVANTERQILAMQELRATMGSPLMAMPRGTGIVPIGGGGSGGFLRGGMGRSLLAAGGLGLMIGGQYLGDAVRGSSKPGSARNTAGRAISDAGMGALFGSFLGPEGMAAGAGIGGLIGLFKGLSVPSRQQNQIAAMNKELKALPAPTRKSIQDSAVFRQGTVSSVRMRTSNDTPSRGGGGVGVYKGPSKVDTVAAKKMVDAALQNAQADRIATAAKNLYVQSILAEGKADRASAQTISQAALAHTDLGKAAAKVGLTQKDLTNAITGSNAEYQRTVGFWKSMGKPTAAQITELAKLRAAYQGSGKAAIDTALAQGKTLASMQREGTVAQLLTGKLVNLNTQHLTDTQAAGMYRQGLLALTNSIENNGATLDQNTLFGRNNAVQIKKSASLALAHAQAVYEQTGSLKKANAALASDRKWIEYVGTAAGLNKGDVDKLLTSLGLIAKSNPHAKVNVDTVTAKNDIDEIQQWLNSMQGKTLYVRVKTTTGSNGLASNPDKGPVQVGLPPTAKGTSNLRDGYFTVGEQGWELGYRRGNKVTIYDNKTSQKMTGLSRVPGFASGTSGTAKGQALADANQRLGSLIGNIGSSYSKPIDVLSVGINRIESQIKSAMEGLGDAIAKGLSKKSAAKFKTEIAALAKMAQQQLDSIRLRINKSDLAAISAGLASSVDDAKTAYDNLIADLKAAGASASVLTRAGSNERAALANDATLLAAKDYRTSITDTLRGNYDSTQYGSVADLLSGMGAQSQQNNTYAGEVNSLRTRATGNKTLTDYINQLAASGQTATLQTLYGSSSGELSQISKAVGDYNSSVNAGGNAAELAKYGKSVDTLQQAQDKLTTAIANLAKGYLKDSAKPQHIHLHVGKEEIASAVVHSDNFDKAVAHLLDQVVNHHTYK